MLADPLHDPLIKEIVAVPTRGVERWLTQQMSLTLGASEGRTDGVCANVEFPFPGRLVGGAIATATGVDRDDDPWRPERAVWPLLEVVEERLDDPPFAALAAHLRGDDAEQGRRFSEVRHLADLFDRYAVHRPVMLRAWADGKDTDGAGADLPEDARWQAALWRHLQHRIGTPSPAERLPDACSRLMADIDVLDWPRRVSIFGLTRLPASYLQALTAIATSRDVHLFLLHPSPALWSRVSQTVADTGLPARRREDGTARLPRNPLLASWGRDAREMQLVLATAADVAADTHHAVDGDRTTLLRRLQAAVHADEAPPGQPLPGEKEHRELLDPDDDSVQIHSCHGRARQVDVVRDAILHLLDTHPELEPRDVIVMCPDIETFAPLIHAAFGVGGDEEPGGTPSAQPGNRPEGLRVRLADRSLRQTNPVLAVVSRLLELAQSRITASEMIDLMARDPVRRRFRFSDDDLARLEEWIPSAGIRWGIDADHRAPFRLPNLAANTWTAGLQRVLAGAVMAEQDARLIGGVLPLDDVGSGDIDLAGRFAELLDRVTAALDALQGPHPINVWVAELARAADALTAAAPSATWQRAQLQRILDEVAEQAANGGSVEIRVAEVRALLADRLRGQPTRANFRTGHVTVCTMVPMRSVPHRVVCLLGLDDQTFPRRTSPDGDDLLARDPHVGDRDPRSEDRQLLLDALLAARNHLVITYAGRSERTNERRPPAVPLGELLDTIDNTVRCLDEDGVEVPARTCVLAEHPLQPFDDRNFRSGAIRRESPWSFDRVACDGARAIAKGAHPRPEFIGGRLAPDPIDVVELDELIRFVQHPVKTFLRRRLGIRLTDRDQEPQDSLPVELTKLEEWGLGQHLLDARLAGIDAAACMAAERARGMLPPGALGEPYLQDIGPVVDQLIERAAAYGTGEPVTLEVNLRLPDGRALVGSVPGAYGTTIRSVSYSRLGPKHRMEAWLRLLGATACSQDPELSATVIGRRPRGRGAAVSILRVPGADPDERQNTALQILLDIVDLFDRGMREALPLYGKTSAAFAEALDEATAVDEARFQWESGWSKSSGWIAREDAEPEHELVLGGRVPFDQLLEDVPLDDEQGPGWDGSEPTRFGRYARRLWQPLLLAEQPGG